MLFIKTFCCKQAAIHLKLKPKNHSTCRSYAKNNAVLDIHRRSRVDDPVVLSGFKLVSARIPFNFKIE